MSGCEGKGEGVCEGKGEGVRGRERVGGWVC